MSIKYDSHWSRGAVGLIDHGIKVGQTTPGQPWKMSLKGAQTYLKFFVKEEPNSWSRE